MGIVWKETEGVRLHVVVHAWSPHLTTQRSFTRSITNGGIAQIRPSATKNGDPCIYCWDMLLNISGQVETADINVIKFCLLSMSYVNVAV